MGKKLLTPLQIASVTTTQRNALTAVDGDLIYNTSFLCYQAYMDGVWVSIHADSVLTTSTTSDYTIGVTNGDPIYGTYIFTGVLTTLHNIFLPIAAAVPPGFEIMLKDSGSVTPAGSAAAKEWYIRVAYMSGDTQEGNADGVNFETIRDPRGSVTLQSDGVSNWNIIDVQPRVRYEFFTATVSAGWRKSLVASSVRMRMIGGGGGGGAGHKNVLNAVGNGGGGGGPGGVTELTLRADQMGATSDVTVGAGGTGPAGRATTGIGTAGGNGGFSYMLLPSASASVAADFGRGGEGGATLGAGIAAYGGFTGPGSSHLSSQMYDAQDGGSNWGFGWKLGGGMGGEGTTPQLATLGSNGPFGGPGGGGGGGASTAAGGVGASYAGAGGDGAHGFYGNGLGAVGGPRGAATGAAGTAGTAITTIVTGCALGGGGGGGGGGRASSGAGGNGGNGGAGALYGGGGGGGGNGAGASGANSSGAGGAGAAGCVEVITYR